MMATSFNMGQYLNNTTQASAPNYHVVDEQSAALNLSVTEENVL